MNSISGLKDAVRTGELSHTEVVQSYIERIEKHNTTYNALITTNFEQALKQAKDLDQGTASADNVLPLRGIPIVHKDIFCTNGIRTSCGSKMLDSFVPPYSATLVERLQEAGCIVLGKSNMDEFAMGSSNEHSYYGCAKNPWDASCVPGGSSGGSAIAVAAHLCLAASGSDTGGSIRQPAAFCGVTGLKPTYGRIPRWGMVAYASSLDTAGFFTHSALDAAHLLGATAGFDVRDATSSQAPVDDYLAQTQAADLHIKKVGVPYHLLDDVPPAIAHSMQQTIDALKQLGVQFVDVTLEHLEHVIATYYIIACAEASSNLSRYDGIRFGHRAQEAKDLFDLYVQSRSEGFGKEVKKRILLGTYVLSADYFDAYYMRALRLRRLIHESWLHTLAGVDALLMPVAPTAAFTLGSKSEQDMYLEDIFTVPMNLIGVPSVSFPAGFEKHLPVGMQLVGNFFQEGHLLQLVHKIQQQTDWHLQSPDLRSSGTGAQ